MNCFYPPRRYPVKHLLTCGIREDIRSHAESFTNLEAKPANKNCSEDTATLDYALHVSVSAAGFGMCSTAGSVCRPSVRCTLHRFIGQNTLHLRSPNLQIGRSDWHSRSLDTSTPSEFSFAPVFCFFPTAACAFWSQCVRTILADLASHKKKK